MPRTEPKDAQWARDFIAEMHSGGTNYPARKRMAEIVQTHGNYTPEGLAVWRDYLARDCNL